MVPIWGDSDYVKPLSESIDRALDRGIQLTEIIDKKICRWTQTEVPRVGTADLTLSAAFSSQFRGLRFRIGERCRRSLGSRQPSEISEGLDHARLDSRTYHMCCLAFETLQATKPRSYTPASVEQGPMSTRPKPTQCTVSKFATLVPIEL